MSDRPLVARLLLIWPCLGALATAACGQPHPGQRNCWQMPQATGVVFAQVGDAPITDAQLQAYEGLAAGGQGNLSLPQVLGKVEDRVRFELLAQAAADRGLAADPEVVEAARKTMVRKLLADDMGPARLGASLPESTLRDYYERHRADFHQPPMRRYVVLLFGNDGLARAQAEAFAKTWHDGGDDARCLAAALKVQVPAVPSKAARPRRKPRQTLHWQEEGFQTQEQVARAYGDDVADAVFAAPPLNFPTAVVQSQRGPVAVRVLAHRQAVARAFEEARPDIVEALVRRQRGQLFVDYLDKIRATYPIAIYEDQIRAWLQRPPGPTPPVPPADAVPKNPPDSFSAPVLAPKEPR